MSRLTARGANRSPFPMQITQSRSKSKPSKKSMLKYILIVLTSGFIIGVTYYGQGRDIVQSMGGKSLSPAQTEELREREAAKRRAVRKRQQEREQEREQERLHDLNAHQHQQYGIISRSDSMRGGHGVHPAAAVARNQHILLDPAIAYDSQGRPLGHIANSPYVPAANSPYTPPANNYAPPANNHATEGLAQNHHVDSPPEPVVASSDIHILNAFFQQTGGPHWKRNHAWGDKNRPMNSWYGVTCNKDGFVKRLDLNENNLQGKLPPILGKLEHLEELILDHNKLTGDLPASFKSDKLRIINLSHNLLSGELHHSICKAVHLRKLYLDNNAMVGDIPECLSDLDPGSVMDLSQNKFNGFMPATFQQWKAEIASRKRERKNVHLNQLNKNKEPTSKSGDSIFGGLEGEDWELAGGDDQVTSKSESESESSGNGALPSPSVKERGNLRGRAEEVEAPSTFLDQLEEAYQPPIEEGGHQEEQHGEEEHEEEGNMLEQALMEEAEEEQNHRYGGEEVPHEEEVMQEGHHEIYGEKVPHEEEVMQEGHHETYGEEVPHEEEAMQEGHHETYGEKVPHEEEAMQEGHHETYGEEVPHEEEAMQEGHHETYGEEVPHEEEAMGGGASELYGH